MAAFDAQHGGFATGWSPVSWGSIDELFVNLTMPTACFGRDARAAALTTYQIRQYQLARRAATRS